MDSAATRPNAIVPTQPAPAGTSAQPQAVRTDLPQAAAVAAIGAAEAVKFEQSRGGEARAQLDAAVRRAVERHLTIDRKTNSLVLTVTREPSGEVVRQIPDEVILRLRAYVRELADKRAAEDATRKVEKIA